MKNKKKIVMLGIVICVLILIIVLFVINSNNNKKNDVKIKNDYGDVKVNTNNGVTGDKKVGDLTFTNTSMIEKNGITTLKTTITNNSKDSKYISSFTIYIKDRNDKIITELIGYVGSELGTGESKIITSAITDDITNAYSVEYKENK